MNRSFIAVAVAILAFGGTAAAQAIAVVGTGDPKVDIPAVQAAVDRGGQVVLKGHFSFDAPPTVAEKPSILFTGAPMGMVLISKAVAISGALDDQDEMTSIEGGINPFYVEAPGAVVTIKGLYFVHSKAVAIRVVAASGLAIASNRIEGVSREAANAAAIAVHTSPGPPGLNSPGQPENISGTVWIVNNDIDMQGTAGLNFLAIIAFAMGKSPDKEVDLHISGNNIRNSTERPINVYNVGGRASIERNVITTGVPVGSTTPSPDVIHIEGYGSYLIAHNSIDCAWAQGAGIRVQTEHTEWPVSHAIVVDNDVNMSAPEGTVFDVNSAAIEVRGASEGNIVLNNRIRGRANFALSVAAQNGAPQNTTFIMNDLRGFTSAQADLFVDAGGTNTIAVGRQNTVEDNGSGTVIVPGTPSEPVQE
jgi:hypothetical protein